MNHGKNKFCKNCAKTKATIQYSRLYEEFWGSQSLSTYTYLSMESGKRKHHKQRKENIMYDYNDENDVCSMATKSNDKFKKEKTAKKESFHVMKIFQIMKIRSLITIQNLTNFKKYTSSVRFNSSEHNWMEDENWFRLFTHMLLLWKTMVITAVWADM